MATKPTILIIPGSYSSADFYTDTVNYLKSYGYDTVVYNLPSASRKPPQTPATLSEDVAFFNGKIGELVGAGRDVIVVPHSYGGLVGTGAVKGLSKEERSTKGLQGGVVKVVYLSACIGRIGQNMVELNSNLDHLQGIFVPVKEDERYGTHIPEKSAPLTMSDMPFDDAIKWIKRMPYQSLQSFADPIEIGIPTDIPLSYVFCTEDKILPPKYQHERIEMLEQDSGRKVDVFNFVGGHVPNASNPQELARLVREAVEKGS